MDATQQLGHSIGLHPIDQASHDVCRGMGLVSEDPLRYLYREVLL
jgi:hypothetical protein